MNEQKLHLSNLQEQKMILQNELSPRMTIRRLIITKISEYRILKNFNKCKSKYKI